MGDTFAAASLISLVFCLQYLLKFLQLKVCKGSSVGCAQELGTLLIGNSLRSVLPVDTSRQVIVCWYW